MPEAGDIHVGYSQITEDVVVSSRVYRKSPRNGGGERRRPRRR